MKILLLGYGFLGRFVYKQLTLHHDVRVLSNNVPDNNGSGFFLRDFSNIDPDDTAFDGVQCIIHTIHTTVPATSMLNLEGDLGSNVFSSIRLLQLMEKRDIDKLVYISSGGAVYGNPSTKLIDESHWTNPLSGYGISKLAIEKYIQLFHRKTGLKYVLLRPSNLFGPNQNLYKPQGIVGHLLNALRNDEEIEIWGSGNGKKDYLYVGDLAKIIGNCVSNFERVGNQTFNSASGHAYSVNEIISIIEDRAGTKIKKKHVGAKGFDVQDVLLDGKKLNRTLGVDSLITIEKFIESQLG